MERIRDQLQAREKVLHKMIQNKKAELVNAPEGFLRISNNGNNVQYYKKADSRDWAGEYIPVKETSAAKKLAQRDYDKQVLRAAEKELAVIQKYLKNYPVINPEKIYANLHKERQKLVCPVQESDEAYIQCWEGVSYTGRGFETNAGEFYTAKGERVRSKSEVIIADLLMREKIPYRYEYPVRLNGWGTVYPDFMILDVKKRKEIIWEHLGMMDDAGYADKAVRKIAAYEQNGIFPGDKLILTYETQKNPLNQKALLMIIRHYLQL